MLREAGGIVSIRNLQRAFALGLLMMGVWAMASTPLAWGQEAISRKVKSKIAPTYPEIARRMNITGVVKVLITVTPTGSVKDVKLVGGHPVLANSAMDAVKKWHFEAGPQESTGIVEFRFDPAQ
jgi:TonB family protein